MSNLPQQETILQYVADGIETEYVFAFYVPLNPDIDVYVTLAGETPLPENDLKILDVDYTVTMNLDPVTGGFITFLPTKIPPVGAIITLNRDVEASLDVEFSNAQNFSGENLDTALDRLLLLIQQNKNYILDRNLSYRINSYLPDSQPFQLEPLQPGYIWQGSPGGGVAAVLLEENPDSSTLRSELANNSPGTNGASLVGYYDTALGGTTVKDYLDNLFPSIASYFYTAFLQPGFMIDYAGTFVPPGWLICDGSAITTTYANLYAAIGTTWALGMEWQPLTCPISGVV